MAEIKDTFNPTHRDLYNIESLILDIKTKKNKLVKTKIGLQNRLSNLRAMYENVEYKSDDFYKIKDTRKEVKLSVANIELEIKNINEELNLKNRLKNEIIHFLKEKSKPETSDDINKLLDRLDILKKKYKEFAKDRTRIASLRIMASEFVDELEKLY